LTTTATNPTEIRATLAAAKQAGFARVHVIFQPHRYTRTQLLMDDFARPSPTLRRSLSSTSIPPVKPPFPVLPPEVLAQRIREQGKGDARYVASFGSAVSSAVSSATAGDLILTLGAGQRLTTGSAGSRTAVGRFLSFHFRFIFS